jgi:adenosine deaminase/DNA-binding NarL/FixJ family response regulator
MTKKRESKKRKYFVCAWNVLEEVGWQQDDLTASVCRLLDVYLGHTQDESEADLVVVIPRGSDGLLDFRDLCFFHNQLQGGKKDVLYIRRGNRPFPKQRSLSWLFCVGSPSFNWEALADWLDRPKADTGQGTGGQAPHIVPALQQEFLRHFPLTAPGDTPADFGGFLANYGPLIDGYLSHTVPVLWKECSSPARLFFGLIRLSSRFSRVEHDIRRTEMELVFLAADCRAMRLGKLELRRRTVEACFDLRHSLAASAAIAEIEDEASLVSPGRNRVLLIDDNPEPIRDRLQRVLACMPVDLKLCVWNPDRLAPNDGKPLRLLDLVEYGSLASRTDRHTRKRKVLYQEVENQEWVTHETRAAESLLRECRFILVDVLFNVDDRDRELGGQVIRGLHRLCRDLPNAGTTYGGSAGSTELPDILAISRADDMGKVEATLRAGAAGYVLKSRMLSLPSVLNRLLYSSQDSVSTLHRNFRSLYSLPSETIGLLRAVRVPKSLTFHRCPTPSHQPSLEEMAVAKLLTAIPKTDLHVHVGSCMRPEFLVVASWVMLLRHAPESREAKDLCEAISVLVAFWGGDTRLQLLPGICTSPKKLEFIEDLKTFAVEVSKCLLKELRPPGGGEEERYRRFRAVLHASHLRIRDHWTYEEAMKELRKKGSTELFLFAMTHAEIGGRDMRALAPEDVCRVFLLYLAAKKQDSSLDWPNGTEVLQWFRSGTGTPAELWPEYHKLFYEKLPHDTRLVRPKSSEWEQGNYQVRIDLKLPDHSNWPLDPLVDAAIPRLVATGLTSRSLRDYLDGCDFSGAEHLRHPYLMHLFAQQVVCEFARQGVLYAELRSAATGYANNKIAFDFNEACRCFQNAIRNAQELIHDAYRQDGAYRQDDAYRQDSKKKKEKKNPQWLWPLNVSWEPSRLFPPVDERDQIERLLPVKIGLVFTGKRHKPTRQMIREGAAAVVLQASTTSGPPGAREFAESAFHDCKLAGFDLAGQEDEYPPELFRTEFEQLAKLHIPITAHAGENASAQFVESAVIDLRSKRLGHGLALSESRDLKNRVREDAICVELCPVSNHQTNQFGVRGCQPPERPYPIRELLENGNAVCINTDNPIISHTNIIKEYFQASYAYGGEGLSLWEALRIIRMGFVHSFMSLPERRAMLELADQIIFDLFTRDDLVDMLRSLAISEA